MIMAKDPRPNPLPKPPSGPLSIPVIKKPSLDETINHVADEVGFILKDANGNDSISKNEWAKSGGKATDFNTFDANHDGKISRDEFHETRKLEREFKAKDKNHDGKLEAKEIRPGHEIENWLGLKPPELELMDKNHDGTVSKQEYIAGKRLEEDFAKAMHQKTGHIGHLTPPPPIKDISTPDIKF